MKKFLIPFFILAASIQARAENVFLPNLGKNATGTTSTTHNGLDVNISSGSITTTSNSEATNGGALPSKIGIVGGYDGANVRVFSVDSTGKLNVNNISGTISLPTGASTAAKQPSLGVAGTASADVITVQGIASMTPLLTTGSGNFTVIQPTGTNLHTVVDSGTVTANIGTTNGLALDATVSGVQGSKSGGTAATSSSLSGGLYNTSAPTLTNGQQAALQLDVNGNLKVAATAVTNQSVNVAQINGVTPLMGNGVTGTGSQRVTIASDNTAFSVNSTLSAETTKVIGVVRTADGSGNLLTSTTNALDVNLKSTTGSALALDASVTETHGTKAAGTAATKSDLVGGVYSSTLPVMTNGQQAALQTDTSGRLIPGVGGNGSGSAAAATVSTVITLTAPAGADGFILMNIDTSTANVRWSIGRTATTTLGQQLQPGRDTGFVPCSHDVSLVAESGTQTYDIQWISQ